MNNYLQLKKAYVFQVPLKPNLLENWTSTDKESMPTTNNHKLTRFVFKNLCLKILLWAKKSEKLKTIWDCQPTQSQNWTMNWRSYVTKMKNWRGNWNNNPDTEDVANNLSKRLSFYQLKFKDWEATQVLLNQNMKVQRRNYLNMNQSNFIFNKQDWLRYHQSLRNWTA